MQKGKLGTGRLSQGAKGTGSVENRFHYNFQQLLKRVFWDKQLKQVIHIKSKIGSIRSNRDMDQYFANQ